MRDKGWIVHVAAWAATAAGVIAGMCITKNPECLCALIAPLYLWLWIEDNGDVNNGMFQEMPKMRTVYAPTFGI